MLRKRLHKLGIRKGFKVVFSPEPVREGSMVLCEETEQKIECRHDLLHAGSIRMPLRSVVIRDLIGEF